MKLLLNTVSILFKAVSFLVIGFRSLKKKRFPEAFIISVDNLSFGGTGKTSLVIEIGRELEGENLGFAIISRGYRSRHERKGTRVTSGHGPGDVGDEAVLFKTIFPSRDIFVGRNRIRSIRSALESRNRFIILDDGFQSSGIEKDLSVMLLNPEHPYHYLRNFRRLARREDIVLEYWPDPEDMPSPEAPSGAGPIRGYYRFITTGFFDRNHRPVDISGSTLAGFSGVGDNRRFLADLSRFRLAGFKAFRDHHRYRQQELLKLDRWRQRVGADHLACTRKDFIKIISLNLEGIPLIYMENTLQLGIDLQAVIRSHAEKKGFL